MWQTASVLWSNESERKKNPYILLGLSSRNRKIYTGTRCVIEQLLYLGYFGRISITRNNLNNCKHLLSYTNSKAYTDDSCKYLLPSVSISQLSLTLASERNSKTGSNT